MVWLFSVVLGHGCVEICVNKEEIAYKVIETLGEQLKHVPGVIGEILDGEDKKENE